jgi:formylglycine-generating enzyme required for sulfatase activity
MKHWLLLFLCVVSVSGTQVQGQTLFEGQRPGQLRTDNSAGLSMRWCPPGQFVMGSPVGEPGRDIDEDPYKVNLSRGFWLGETEVTQEQWKTVMGRTLRDQASRMLNDQTVYRMGGQDVTLRDVAKPQGKGKDEAQSVCAAEAPNVPIYYVSWEDAVEFCRRLTVKEQAAKRISRDVVYALPTEAQWEYACRAGTTTTTYAGNMTVLGNNNVPILHEIAWYGGNSSRNYGGRGWATNFPDQAFPGTRAGPRRVGQLQPNAWQLRDMLGNLYEWVQDYSGYYPQREVRDPTGPAKGEKKLFRGGSWNHYGTMCRAARRFEEIPTIRLNYIGFRVCMSLRVGLAGLEVKK